MYSRRYPESATCSLAQISFSSVWRVTSEPGLRAKNSSIRHSVGVRCTRAPARVTALAARSTSTSPNRTTDSPLDGTERRACTRSRASSSSIWNGLVT
ncbi:hypothetical protein SRABI128_00259 [Microbacterium sp. Bi128]|nr:hypothetical protein SRABI128_00259 [Microbacterium sp. Bi128]